MSPLGAGLYVGTGSMTLGVSGAAPQMSSVFGNQTQSSSSATAAAAQFDHIIPSSSPGSSMFHSQAPSSSSSFFLAGCGGPPAQVFSEDGDLSQDSQQSSHLLHGKSPARFNGLMQLPEQSQQGSNASGYNLLNLGFFSSNNGGAAGGQDARLDIQDQFNGGNSNAKQRSVMASLGNHLSGNFCSLYNSSGSSAGGGLPQNSATALLLKAAQMGSTSSNHNNSSVLLRAAGFGGANASQGNRAAGEGSSAPARETHFHDLIMNSLAGGTAGLDDGKLSTRDFLGVGRGSMAPLGLHIGALDPAQMK
jgi:hypothetical protein